MLYLVGKVRNYCIENDLFSSGTNRQYSKMFDCLCKDKIDFGKVATMIWICSETTKTIEEIEQDLKKIAKQ